MADRVSQQGQNVSLVHLTGCAIGQTGRKQTNMKKELTPIESLPYIEELLRQTGTSREQWLFGATAISAALDLQPYHVYTSMEGLEAITRRIRTDGSAQETVWVALKSDVAAYLEARKPKPSALVVNQNGHGPAEPPAPAASHVGLTPDTLADVHALRDDVRGLRSDLTSLRQSVNELARVIDTKVTDLTEYLK